MKYEVIGESSIIILSLVLISLENNDDDRGSDIAWFCV